MHYVVQRHMDRKAGTTPDNAHWEEIREELAGQDELQAETKKVPALYAPSRSPRSSSSSSSPRSS